MFVEDSDDSSKELRYNYRYRLYPSPEQEEVLEETLELCRQLYNEILKEFKDEETAPTSFNTVRMKMKDITKEDERYSSIHSRVKLMVSRRFYSNVRNVDGPHQTSRIGRLRYKGENWYKTFNYNQSGFEVRENDCWTDSLWLSKIGEIPMRYHRDIPEGAEVPQVTIKRSRSGEWYAIFCVNKEVSEPEMDSDAEDLSYVGIGAGYTHFLADTEGNAIESLPRDSSSRKRRRDDLDRKQYRSNNWNDAYEQFYKEEEHLSEKRRDVLHKLSRRYIDMYDVIVVEHRYIGLPDTAWWDFLDMLSYKAESANTMVIWADSPQDTDQNCPNCGVSAAQSLWMEHCGCPSCGNSLRRPVEDINSVFSRITDDSHEGKLQLLLGPGWAKETPVDTPASMDTVSISSVVESGSYDINS